MAGEEAAAAAASAEGREAGNGGGGYDSKCVFCRIARREETGTALLPCQYDDLVCFRDIRPGAPHHYLVVPVEHMGNCKTLKTEHVPVVQRMVEVGKAVLQRNNFNDLNDVRMGFHWPPFCSISHLHLHVLAPASQLGFLSRLIYRINSYWFITTRAYSRCFDAAKNLSLQGRYSILVSLLSPKTKMLKQADQLIERLQNENAAS